MENPDITRAKRQITDFISEHAPVNGVIVGISGGIDSTLVLTMCVEALGKEKTFGIFMPEKETDPGNDIKQYVKELGIEYETIPIKPIVDAYALHAKVSSNDRLVIGNLKARIRMSLLYSRSNSRNLVVMGTGNRSELLTGYFTRYGDGGVDYLPIGDLYKTEVRQLAKQVGVPKSIIEQPPSADLWAGQTDEKELGVTYAKLDLILREHFDKDTPFEKIDLPDITEEDIQKVRRRVENAAFKLTMPPICPIR